MKRYYREDNGDLYDRQAGVYLTVITERRSGSDYHIQEASGEHLVIPVGQVEEPR